MSSPVLSEKDIIVSSLLAYIIDVATAFGQYQEYLEEEEEIYVSPNFDKLTEASFKSIPSKEILSVPDVTEISEVTEPVSIFEEVSFIPSVKELKPELHVSNYSIKLKSAKSLVSLKSKTKSKESVSEKKVESPIALAKRESSPLKIKSTKSLLGTVPVKSVVIVDEKDDESSTQAEERKSIMKSKAMMKSASRVHIDDTVEIFD